MKVDIVAGYLGSGKTTTILGLIEAHPAPSELVVLVNEFGEIGVDAALMGELGEVVELASGCICCTLRMDFRAQIEEIAALWNPERLLIEPTGVATIAQVLRALGHPSLTGTIEGVRVFVVVDASSFNERLRESPEFFRSQVRQADVVLLNKVDVVGEARAATLAAALESIAPDAWVVRTFRGRLPGTALPPPRPVGDVGEEDAIMDLESVSRIVESEVDERALRSLFDDLAAGRYGRIERAKAVLRTAGGWTRYDLASGRVDREPWGPAPEGRVAVIGRDIARDDLEEALESLAAG